MTKWGALGSDAPEPRAVARRLKAAMAVDVPTGCPLSPSEYGVIRQLALGLTYKADGPRLPGCRSHDPHAHPPRLLEAGVVDRAQAVLRCARELAGQAVEIGDVEKPDPLRSFARRSTWTPSTSTSPSPTTRRPRAAGRLGRGLGLGRLHRDRTTRNDFIDAVIDG